MSNKQKATLCALGVSLLTLIGTIATPLCHLLPTPWQTVCLVGVQTGVEAVKLIPIPDAGH